MNSPTLRRDSVPTITKGRPEFGELVEVTGC